jgi:hypothetical protein
VEARLTHLKPFQSNSEKPSEQYWHKPTMHLFHVAMKAEAK